MEKKCLPLLAIVLVLASCASPAGKNPPETPIASISKAAFVDGDYRSAYYQVFLNLDKAGSHLELGRAYGKAISDEVPYYASDIDAYFGDALSYLPSLTFDEAKARMVEMRKNVPTEYADEIDGISEYVCTTSVNAIGDGKLSPDELWVANLLPDIARTASCSGLGVWGSGSEGGISRIVRNLEWFCGSYDELTYNQAVLTIKQGDHSICMIGYLGFVGILSAANAQGVFAAILDSDTDGAYDATGKRSYIMDLRKALESSVTAAEVGAYMIDASRAYAFNHNILIADADGAIVAENQVDDGSGNAHRAIRHSDSALRGGLSWDNADAMGVVNSFLLDGSYDNHSGSSSNTQRWQSLIDRMKAGTDAGETMNAEELKAVGSYCGGDGPQSPSTGDLYCRNTMVTGMGTQQIIYFEPSTLDLEVFFRPIYSEIDGTSVPMTEDLPTTPRFVTVDTKLN